MLKEKDVASLRKDENLTIPAGFDYGRIEGLSNEMKAKLMQVNPSSIAQAGRIDGVTPAARWSI